MLAFLVACVLVGLPCPILSPNGEQGSAKTTLCRVLKAIVDPNKTALRRPPRNSEDLMVAARNTYLLAIGQRELCFAVALGRPLRPGYRCGLWNPAALYQLR